MHAPDLDHAVGGGAEQLVRAALERQTRDGAPVSAEHVQPRQTGRLPQLDQVAQVAAHLHRTGRVTLQSHQARTEWWVT